MKKHLITFNEFLKEKNLYEKYGDWEELGEFLDELQRRSPYIYPDPDGRCDEESWVLDCQYSPSMVDVRLVDETGDTKLPCFALLHNVGLCVLFDIEIKRGKGIDNDLDWIYATYKKRTGIGGVKQKVQIIFNELVKKYGFYYQSDN